MPGRYINGRFAAANPFDFCLAHRAHLVWAWKAARTGKGLGKGIREFKDALRTGGMSSSTEAPSDKKEEEKKS